MSWGKKKKHASQNTIPAAEFRQEGESALFEKAPKEPSKPAPGEYLDNPVSYTHLNRMEVNVQ